MINFVVITETAKRGLRKAPGHIQRKFATWVQTVELLGLERVRQIPGYHDEPLKGPRTGQRSIRLNKAYRAIYRVKKDGSVEFASVEEVHHHEY